MPALALTDRNNLYGALDFYKACKREGIKPLIGVDIDFSIESASGHLVLIAKNIDGYRNLLKLVSNAHLDADTSPVMKRKHIESYGAGLIALIPDTALLGSSSGVLIDILKGSLGADNVYARLGWNGGRERLLRTLGFSEALRMKLAAADGTYYLKPEDRDARDIVRRIADPATESDGNDRAFASPALLEERYREFPQAVNGMEEIVESVSLDLPLGSWVFPKFPIPEGTTAEKELEKQARAGFTIRNIEPSEELEERLRYELSVINGKGFAPYFLTVADLLAFARTSGILTTTRGSAAGSFVSYLTGITNVDPIAYRLPFERFLNPERPKAPDIDMDFADTRRDEMIAYAKKRYGDDCVAQIGTFGTMAARASVRDVARALGYPYAVGDRIAKLIPMGSQGFPMTIDRALEIEEDLRKLRESDEDAEIVIDTAKRIEGNARHISIHAAGIVIAPSAVTDFVPVQRDPSGSSVITQYDMHAVEDAGLLKFDFLGLKNLSILGDAIIRVEVRTGTKIDIEAIPLDDARVFDMLQRGLTESVFQLSGSGMTHYLKDLKPSSIHDINAMVALYRPGPMESIPEYIARKNNPHLVTYLDPRLKNILDRSYGIITYQDDVLLIAVELGGYTWLQADELRRAMGKKIPEVMRAEKAKLVQGFIEHGKLSAAKAEAIWKLIEPFAAYGFGKAHAASYGKVAYQTAYMKAHYPTDYMAAVLTADSGDVEKVHEHVGECERIGIKVWPPDVNESMSTFTAVAEGSIRFGLSSIKNFGEAAALAIIEERDRGGRFKSITDFLERIPQNILNRRSLEALIKSGVFDSFEMRGTLYTSIEQLLTYAKETGDAPSNQGSLFSGHAGLNTLTLTSAPVTDTEMLAWEKELLGIYVSGHPLDRFHHALAEHRGSIKRARAEERNNYPVIVAGVVESVKSIFTKKGDRMGFIKISDKEASLETVAFPEVFKANTSNFSEGTCILVKGKISKRNGEPSLLIDKVKSLA